MKGPHFFEKRKKEMARQEKAKQKAERKAQRKAGKGKDDPDDPDEEETTGEDLNSEAVPAVGGSVDGLGGS